MFIKNSKGEAPIKFRVIDNKMPDPLIFWREPEIKPKGPDFKWQGRKETMLKLAPPIENCEEISFFVNAGDSSPILLSNEDIELDPIQLKSQSEEQSVWNQINLENCAVLLTLGSIEEDNFTGISASTRNQVFRRYTFGIRDRIPDTPLWIPLIFGPGAEIFSPVLVLAGVVYSAEKIVEAANADSCYEINNVKVLFEFPNGKSAETTISCDESKKLIGKYKYPIWIKPKIGIDTKWQNIRYWMLSALIKLKLEYSEDYLKTQSYPLQVLTSVEGYKGKWRVETDDDSHFTVYSNNRYMRKARVLRFYIDNDVLK